MMMIHSTWIFYYQDCIHLNHKGNEKLCNTIIRKLKYIESLSPLSSSSSDIILRIPSAEAPQKVVRGMSSVLSPPTSVLPQSSPCHTSQSSSLVSRHPLFTEVPKSVYDHDKQLLALSSRPVCSSSSCLSSLHRPRSTRHHHHRSQLQSLPLLSPDGGDRSDDSGCDASPASSWSFLSFLMMLLSSISLPITTFSYYFTLFIHSLSCHMSRHIMSSHSRSRSSRYHSRSSRHHSRSSRHRSSRPHRTLPQSQSIRSYSHLLSFPIRTPSYIHKLISGLFLFLFAFYVICLLTHTPFTDNLTCTPLTADCESELDINQSLNCSDQSSLNISLSLNCSNQSSSNISQSLKCSDQSSSLNISFDFFNDCFFLPDKYLFLKSMPCSENTIVVIVLGKIEDTNLPSSNLSILKAFTADLTDCESSLNISQSLNCSNQSSSLDFSNAPVFLPDKYLFSKGTPYSENTIGVTLRFGKIGDTNLPSNLSFFRACIFVIFFCLRILVNWTGMRLSVIHNESRYFIRKRLHFRKQKKMCTVGHVFLLTLLLRKEGNYIILSHNVDFFTLKFIKSCKLSFGSNICYPICFHLSKRSYFRIALSYMWIILFLCGDLELNPGPINYQLHHPNLCGYYRTAIFSVFKGNKMIPRKDKNGNDIFEQPDFEEGLNDLKIIFGAHYAVQELEIDKLEKIKKKKFGS